MAERECSLCFISGFADDPRALISPGHPIYGPARLASFEPWVDKETWRFFVREWPCKSPGQIVERLALGFTLADEFDVDREQLLRSLGRDPGDRQSLDAESIAEGMLAEHRSMFPRLGIPQVMTEEEFDQRSRLPLFGDIPADLATAMKHTARSQALRREIRVALVPLINRDRQEWLKMREAPSAWLPLLEGRLTDASKRSRDPRLGESRRTSRRRHAHHLAEAYVSLRGLELKERERALWATPR